MKILFHSFLAFFKSDIRLIVFLCNLFLFSGNISFHDNESLCGCLLIYLSNDWLDFKYGNFIVINYLIEYCLSPIHSILYLWNQMTHILKLLRLFFMSFSMSFVFLFFFYFSLLIWTIVQFYLPVYQFSLVISLLFNCPN